jgi:cytochrome P450
LLHDRLRALTLRVILHSLFGHGDARVAELHARLLSMLSMTAGVGLTLPATRVVPGGRASWRRFLRDRATADALLMSLVRERRSSTTEHADALALLLAARHENGRPLSDRYVRDSLMSLVLAGHETTAAELSWAFQLLAHHPRVQAELTSNGGREYLKATTLEVLRHRPVFLFAIPRAVAAPIEIGGWTYLPGAQLLVPPGSPRPGKRAPDTPERVGTLSVTATPRAAGPRRTQRPQARARRTAGPARCCRCGSLRVGGPHSARVVGRRPATRR